MLPEPQATTWAMRLTFGFAAPPLLLLVISSAFAVAGSSLWAAAAPLVALRLAVLFSMGSDAAVPIPVAS